MKNVRSFSFAIKKWLSTLLLILAPSVVVSAPIPISESPLFITVNIAPNVVVTLDDSGSMGRAYVPDLCGNPDNPNCATLDNRYAKSAYFNPLYYDPTTTYLPAKDAAGNNLSACSDNSSVTKCFKSVYLNGFDATRGEYNMESEYRPTAGYSPPATKAQAEVGTANSGVFPADYYRFMKHFAGDFSTQTASVQAYYYVFKPTNVNCTSTDKTDNDCYTKVLVSSSSGPGSIDERLNFANWFAFYRTRNLMTMTAVSRSMASFDDSTRVAWQALNSCSTFGTTCAGTDGVNRDNRIRTFSQNKSAFYAWLFRLPAPPPNSTPLRTAFKRAGEYFNTTGVNSPYAIDPQTTLGTEHSCRKNFQIVMTDGRWNETAPSLSTGMSANHDNTAGTLPAPDSMSFTASKRPYFDSNNSSLADFAFYYWARDLRSDLDNNITPNTPDKSGTATDQYWNAKNDPAKWQHMVNYLVGLGVKDYIPASGLTWGGDTYSGSYDAIKTGPTNWPATSNNSDGNIADLWHAAVNSRGKFFSAEKPEELNAAFNAIVTSVQDATPSSAALSANSTSIQTGTLVYQAKFDSKDWSGTLLALPVQGDGSIGSVQWDAAKLVPAHAARNILSHRGGAGTGRGISFSSCTGAANAGIKAVLDLNAAGVDDGQCANRLNWLRGQSITGYRTRPTVGGIYIVMGDIINSDPAFVHTENYGYSNLPSGTPGQSTYASFVTGKTTNTNRPPMIYVGANDGMLHAIRADTGSSTSGQEQFAYVPLGVQINLSKLTDPNYIHTYFVDGAPSSGDAYLNSAWKTVLLGGLNAGGKTIYALDITNPLTFGANQVMWEYTDADMGKTYSQPQIARLNNGDWAAIFGNGYNSPNEHPYLYIVNLETGVLIKKISAGTLCSIPPCSNGLSTPYLHDENNDKIIDAVYAGDLQGNMWKFDLSDSSTGDWEVDFSGSPLFTARNGSGGVQPITSQPKVGTHPTSGYMVYFGTGRYLTNDLSDNDLTNTSIQTFYGVWDDGSNAVTTTDRSELLAQTITFQGQVQKTDPDGNTVTNDVRTTSPNAIDWATQKGWYLDLLEPSGTPRGERVVSTSLIKSDRVIFVTLIPNTDPCTPGGESWLMEISTLTGGALSESVFDLNNDDLFDTSDLVNSSVVSGVKSTVGISKTPVWLDKNNEIAFKELSGTSGGIATIKNKGAGGGGGSVGRVYWMQIL
jgi:type IV pilus assembly protein PilY1